MEQVSKPEKRNLFASDAVPAPFSCRSISDGVQPPKILLIRARSFSFSEGGSSL